jgi:hypothetical protein
VDEYTPPLRSGHQINDVREQHHPQLRLKSTPRPPKTTTKREDNHNTRAPLPLSLPSLEGSSREEQISPRKIPGNMMVEKPQNATSVLSAARIKRQQLRVRTSPRTSPSSQSKGEKIRIRRSCSTAETEQSKASSSEETFKDRQRCDVNKSQPTSILSAEFRAEIIKILRMAESYQMPPAPKSSTSIKKWWQQHQLKAAPISSRSPQTQGDGIIRIHHLMESTEKAKVPSTKGRPRTLPSHSEEQELRTEEENSHRRNKVDSPLNSTPSLIAESSSSLLTTHTGDLKITASESPAESFDSPPRQPSRENTKKCEQMLDSKPKSIGLTISESESTKVTNQERTSTPPPSRPRHPHDMVMFQHLSPLSDSSSSPPLLLVRIEI